MNANKTMDRLGSKPLIDLLLDVFGRRGRGATLWSTATDFEESAWNFQSTLERTHDLGLATFFNVWVSEDDKQPTKNILQVVTAVQRDPSKRYLPRVISTTETLCVIL